MKKWKINQEIYHRLNTVHDDDLSNFDYEISDDIVNNAVRYFKERDIGWIWPAKSYMVAICYSKWLSENFGGDPIDYLSDPELLYNNDDYYKPYFSNQFVYDSILDQIGGWNFDQNKGVVPEVKYYYEKEFMYSDLTK